MYTTIGFRKLYLSIILFITWSTASFAQIDSVNVPKGVVYNYCNPATLDKAKKLLQRELSANPKYELNNTLVIVGPMLWTRYKNNPLLGAITGGNTTILYNNEKLSAKALQDMEDFKKVWDQLRFEVHTQQFNLRKATHSELRYYWSVISFDILEPLLIAETKEHKYIFNLDPKSYKLIWLDEAPAN